MYLNIHNGGIVDRSSSPLASSGATWRPLVPYPWSDPYLGAEGGLLVEEAVDEVAVLAGGDLAVAVDADTARVADHLTGHVLGRQTALWRDGTDG